MLLQEPNSELYSYQITGRDGIYTMSWDDLHIEAHIDRIRESHDHEVRAEVLITSARPTSSGHLRQGRIILTSPTSRRAMSKSLEERDAEVDWDKIMELLSSAVLQEFRAGTPVTQLSEVDVEAQAKFLINPIVQLHNPTLIYGPGSSGKSWFAQYLAVLADSGSKGGGFEVEPSNVLYLDWETSKQELGTRITMIRRGLGIDGGSGIWYKPMHSGLASDIEEIRKVVVDKEISFIIIDSIGSACMGEPESADVVLRTFGALRSLGVTSLCIDHTNKEGHLFGSVYKFNASRQVFEIKKNQQSDDDKIIVGLFHRKANNSKLIRDIGLELQFTAEGSTILTRRDIRDTPLADQMGVRDRILTLLRKGSKTPAEIAEELDKGEAHVRNVLSVGAHASPPLFRLLKDPAGKSRYALATDPRYDEELDKTQEIEPVRIQEQQDEGDISWRIE